MTFSTYQKAAGFMVVGVLSMSVMDVMAKTVGTHVPVGQIVWLRFVTQAVLIGFFLLNIKQKPFESRHLKLHALRGLATTLSSFLFFLGVIHLPLADATALIQLGPVAVTVGAVLFLGEKIGRRRLAGILVAFLGAIVIIRPDTSIMSSASLYPIFGTLGFAFYALVTRFVRVDGPWVSLFLQGFFGAIFSSLFVPFVWKPIPVAQLPALSILVLAGIIGHLFMIKAFSSAPASIIAPFGYAGLLFATLFGVIIFKEVPDLMTMFGAMTIVSAGLYVWYRDKITQATV
tara:strand:- start:1198 stop:2061 length:864 start_codon:yes stop_codon:yes gene_type:complete